MRNTERRISSAKLKRFSFTIRKKRVRYAEKIKTRQRMSKAFETNKTKQTETKGNTQGCQRQRKLSRGMISDGKIYRTML